MGNLHQDHACGYLSSNCELHSPSGSRCRQWEGEAQEIGTSAPQADFTLHTKSLLSPVSFASRRLAPACPHASSLACLSLDLCTVNSSSFSLPCSAVVHHQLIKLCSEHPFEFVNTSCIGSVPILPPDSIPHQNASLGAWSLYCGSMIPFFPLPFTHNTSASLAVARIAEQSTTWLRHSSLDYNKMRHMCATFVCFGDLHRVTTWSYWGKDYTVLEKYFCMCLCMWCGVLCSLHICRHMCM